MCWHLKAHLLNIVLGAAWEVNPIPLRTVCSSGLSECSRVKQGQLKLNTAMLVFHTIFLTLFALRMAKILRSFGHSDRNLQLQSWPF